MDFENWCKSGYGCFNFAFHIETINPETNAWNKLFTLVLCTSTIKPKRFSNLGRWIFKLIIVDTIKRKRAIAIYV